MNEKVSWHEACLDDLEHSALSYEELGRKYGRSRYTIIKLQKRFNVMRRNPVLPKGAAKIETKRPLSSAHRAIGSRLTVYRGSRNYTDVADELNVSRYVLKLMELGAHDFTLSQLDRISALLRIPIAGLIAPIPGVFRQPGLHSEKEAE